MMAGMRAGPGTMASAERLGEDFGVPSVSGARDVGKPASVRLGDMLVAHEVITRDQLDDALLRQRRSGRRLGEELVRAGHVESRMIASYLDVQRQLRYATLATAIVLAAAQPLRAHAGVTSAAVGVQASVPARAAIQVDFQATTIAVSAADVARGYVDVAAASRVRVTTNSRAGYVVDFHARMPIFQSVQVRSATFSGELGPEGGSMVARGRGGRGLAAEFGYRFVLTPGVAPGTYAWPLAVGIRPLP